MDQGQMKEFERWWQGVLEECSKVAFPYEEEVDLPPKEEIVMVLDDQLTEGD